MCFWSQNISREAEVLIVTSKSGLLVVIVLLAASQSPLLLFDTTCDWSTCHLGKQSSARGGGQWIQLLILYQSPNTPQVCLTREWLKTGLPPKLTNKQASCTLMVVWTAPCPANTVQRKGLAECACRGPNFFPDINAGNPTMFIRSKLWWIQSESPGRSEGPEHTRSRLPQPVLRSHAQRGWLRVGNKPTGPYCGSTGSTYSIHPWEGKNGLDAAWVEYKLHRSEFSSREESFTEEIKKFSPLIYSGASTHINCSQVIHDSDQSPSVLVLSVTSSSADEVCVWVCDSKFRLDPVNGSEQLQSGGQKCDISSRSHTHAQWQVHYPREPFLMLLWQPISFDMTALETLTPQWHLIFLPRRGDSVFAIKPSLIHQSDRARRPTLRQTLWMDL